jgi:hypothetical protein
MIAMLKKDFHKSNLKSRLLYHALNILGALGLAIVILSGGE